MQDDGRPSHGCTDAISRASGSVDINSVSSVCAYPQIGLVGWYGIDYPATECAAVAAANFRLFLHIAVGLVLVPIFLARAGTRRTAPPWLSFMVLLWQSDLRRMCTTC